MTRDAAQRRRWTFYEAIKFGCSPLTLSLDDKSRRFGILDWGMRMRGDQLARQRRVLRAIEASPNGLTLAELAKREETGIRSVYRDLEALQAAGFPLYTEKVERANRWAFIDTFKFKVPPPFPLTEFIPLYYEAGILFGDIEAQIAHGDTFHNDRHSCAGPKGCAS